ncbi:MAG: class I SAM-dependent methyltransferase [Nanoarchaeota archaeon]
MFACPTNDCHNELTRKRNETYFCSGCETTYFPDGANREVINLFPSLRERIAKPQDFDVAPVTFRSFEISRGHLRGLLASSSDSDLRRAAEIISDLTSSVKGRSDVENTVNNLVGAYDKAYRTYSHLLGSSAHNLTQAVTLARYEAETEIARSYSGTFVLPDAVMEQIPEGSRVLEIAMAGGENISAIREKRNLEQAVGCDFAFGFVHRARGFDPELIALRADAQNLPFQTNYFDVVVMLNALDRIPQQSRALREIGRVCKESDSVVILGNCNPLQYEKEVGGGVNLVYVPGKDRVGSVKQAVKKAGFSEDFSLQKQTWNITTVEDGRETLYVDISVGKR